MTPLMSILIQLVLDIAIVFAFVFLWIKFKRRSEEDPRMTSGLQILQNKIAVLEDLGDRTETQVKQLSTILEKKLIEVQKKIDQADGVLDQITNSMEKSIEVAKIFQDKIPHNEIIERQNTVKFVKAALLANQGKSADEIAEEVDLSRGELDFIVKVNKEELSFDEEQLPEWVMSELKSSQTFLEKDIEFIEPAAPLKPSLKTTAGVSNFDQEALKQLGEKFRQAQFVVQQHKNQQATPEDIKIKTEESPVESKVQVPLSQRAREIGIRPVVFPKIEVIKSEKNAERR